MKLIYIAGRYRGHTREAVASNIQAALFVGRLVAEKGYMPVIPHANTAGFEHLCELGDEFWLDGTLELMRRCDAVVLVAGWQESSGTLGEIEEATALGIPVFESAHALGQEIEP